MLVHSQRLQELDIDANVLLSSLHLAIEPYTVYVSGSIIEGHGNADSDLDIFVIYTENVLPSSVRADFKIDEAIITMEYTEKWRLDVESWSKADVLSVAEYFHRLTSTGDNRTAIRVNDLNFAHKLRTAIPILHPDNFHQLYTAFDFKGICRLITRRNLTTYNGVQEDAAGAIASKQYGTALLTARQAAQIAIDAWLAFHGETNIADKWRFVKLEKFGDPALLERYWQVEAPEIKNREDILLYAKNCLNFANQLIIKMQKTEG